MEQPEARRRFAPIPIETSIEHFRKNGNGSAPGPAGEPTPSPSPRSESPPPPREAREKRRFYPQLVESSIRRSRRAGDIGPATKHTDRTDITPYTNHIYVPRSRRKHEYDHEQESSRSPEARKHHGSALEPGVDEIARRESCDDKVAGSLFDLVAKDAQRKLQEIAMSAFPNSNIRIGGAEHYYVREGSYSDSEEAPRGRRTTRGPGDRRPSRRHSSEVGWAVKEMQEHSEKLALLRGDRMSSIDLDQMDLEGPPEDSAWASSMSRHSVSSAGSRHVIGESHMPLITEQPPTIREQISIPRSASPSPIRPIGETFMPYMPTGTTAPGRIPGMPYVSSAKIPAETSFRSAQIPPETGFRSSRIPPETGFRTRGVFRGGFGGFAYGGDDYSADRERPVLHRFRTNASPPLLGKDLVFRKFPSPKQTKLEPEHRWDVAAGTTLEETNRDVTGSNGLWHGYCFTTNEEKAMEPFERMAMISTPRPLAHGSADPFASAFGAARSVGSSPPSAMSPADESTPTATRKGSTAIHLGVLPSEYRSRPAFETMNSSTAIKKGIHMLQGLDERLKREKAAAELEERIAVEFDDAFIDQVYNYLSLGYPAMARSFDDELSKIGGVSIDELRCDDDAIMVDFNRPARGHIVARALRADADGDKEVKEDGVNGAEKEKTPKDRSPRWMALRRYTREWAKQHPDLDHVSPFMEGLRERRGSWGI